MYLGSLEAGGTKMVCAIGTEKGEILDKKSIPTTTPEETMPLILDYFRKEKIEAIGVACFGPIDLNPDSTTYGYITSTPKLAWKNYNIVGVINEALKIPVGFDTDVNGSLLGEITWGCAKGLTDAAYFTIGTGIGAGIMSNGKLIHGMLHPEAGHMLLTPVPGDSYIGKCPYHKNCFEGLVSGPAIEARWGIKASDLSLREEVWELESEYIAQALVNIIMVLSPQKIILGGGVMHQTQLFSLIRKKVLKRIHGYIVTSELNDIEHYIVPASLNDDQGILGGIKLAVDSLL